MSKKIELLIIDPQVSFCDPNKGSLYVKGAEEDMRRLATMISKIGSKISQIHVTLDSHHFFDVAHPAFWRNSERNSPSVFTIISTEDVRNGVWLPVIPNFTQRMIDYTKQLEDGGRYPLCIWPPHCLIGSIGQTVFPILYEVLLEWEKRPWVVNYVTKGSNIFTEHYSAVKAEVPDPKDSSTQLNTELIKTLEEADIILVAGEAGSHCLKSTVEDIISEFQDDSYVKKMVLLEDATSPVTSFEDVYETFKKEIIKKGMLISSTVDFLT